MNVTLVTMGLPSMQEVSLDIVAHLVLVEWLAVLRHFGTMAVLRAIQMNLGCVLTHYATPLTLAHAFMFPEK
jgi:hypothetical protein